LLTLATPVTAEFVIRHSRFVTHAAPVVDQAACLAHLNAVSDPAASHNCWAWKLEEAYRFNDGGEPPGTAGRPILTAIEGKKLCRVSVVVTRYFGGIKLGAGGLIRAYSGCAAKCLDQGQVIETHPTSHWVVKAGFAWTGKIHDVLDACAIGREREHYTAEGICLHLEVRDDCLPKLQNMLRDATKGAAKITRL